MKTKKFAQKLNLNKKTISRLNREELRAGKGGEDTTPVKCMVTWITCWINSCEAC